MWWLYYLLWARDREDRTARLERECQDAFERGRREGRRRAMKKLKACIDEARKK